MMKRYIFILATALFALAPFATSAATPSLGGPAQVTAGSTFSVPVFLSTAAGESANAVSGTVSYSSQLLTLVAISKATSIITLWPQDPSSSGNSAQFEGVILNPGWSGNSGIVVTLTFQAKSAAGVASLAFTDASVLANDGKGTPILSGTTPKSIAINAAPTPTPTQVQTPVTPTKPAGTKQTPQEFTSSTTPQQALPEASVQVEPQTNPAIQWQTDITSLSFLVILLICVLLLALWYFWSRFHRLRKHSTRLDRTHRLLHEQFGELRAAVIEEMATLERVRTKRELTNEEEHFVKRLKAKLDEAEAVIEKEIDTALTARSAK